MYILILRPMIKYIYYVYLPIIGYISINEEVRIQLLVYGLFLKTAVTYSPTFTQYHRHDRA